MYAIAGFGLMKINFKFYLHNTLVTYPTPVLYLLIFAKKQFSLLVSFSQFQKDTPINTDLFIPN